MMKQKVVRSLVALVAVLAMALVPIAFMLVGCGSSGNGNGGGNDGGSDTFDLYTLTNPSININSFSWTNPNAFGTVYRFNVRIQNSDLEGGVAYTWVVGPSIGLTMGSWWANLNFTGPTQHGNNQSFITTGATSMVSVRAEGTLPNSFSDWTTPISWTRV